MKKSLVLLLFLLIPSVIADCNPIQNNKIYSTSREFCGLNFFAPDGIIISGNDITIDCGTAVMRGSFETPGITVIDSDNVLIKDCHVANYEIGFLLINSTRITVEDTGMIRNILGIKLDDSNQNYFENINDISLERMVRAVNSIDNYFDYSNKNLEDDLCRYNSCNEVFVPEPQTLQEILSSAIKNWLAI